MYICTFIPSSNIKCIYFDNIFNDREQKNVCNMFIGAYIISIWKTRKENLRIAVLKSIIVNKVLNIFESIEMSQHYTLERVIGNYASKCERNILLRL